MSGPFQIMTLQEAEKYLGYATRSDLRDLFDYCGVRVFRLPVAPGRDARNPKRLLRAEVEAIPIKLHNQGPGVWSPGNNKYPIRVDEDGNVGD